MKLETCSNTPMPDFSALMDGMEAVVDEIDVHCRCLAQELEPEHRQQIELNLAGGCARGLMLIAMHQQLLNLQLDVLLIESLAVES